MNFSPLQAIPTGKEPWAPRRKVSVAESPPSVDSESAPKVEIAKRQNTQIPSIIPEHEVKVQLNLPEDDTVIYQFLDKNGAVVLQVPPAEELRRIHDTTQELLQRMASEKPSR